MNKSAVILSSAWILWSGTYNIPGNDQITRQPNPKWTINPGWIPIAEFEEEKTCTESGYNRVRETLKNPPRIKDFEFMESKSHPHLVIVRYKEHETVIHYQCFPSGSYPKDRNQ